MYAILLMVFMFSLYLWNTNIISAEGGGVTLMFEGLVFMILGAISGLWEILWDKKGKGEGKRK